MMGDILATILLVVGVFFLTVAAIGFIRLPDVFCRLHITGVIDTMGAPVILLAAAVYLGWTLESGKLLLAIVFLYFTAPLVGHLLGRAALQAGYRPVLEEEGEGAASSSGAAADQARRSADAGDNHDDPRVMSTTQGSTGGGDA